MSSSLNQEYTHIVKRTVTLKRGHSSFNSLIIQNAIALLQISI